MESNYSDIKREYSITTSYNSINPKMISELDDRSWKIWENACDFDFNSSPYWGRIHIYDSVILQDHVDTILFFPKTHRFCIVMIDGSWRFFEIEKLIFSMCDSDVANRYLNYYGPIGERPILPIPMLEKCATIWRMIVSADERRSSHIGCLLIQYIPIPDLVLLVQSFRNCL